MGARENIYTHRLEFCLRVCVNFAMIRLLDHILESQASSVESLLFTIQSIDSVLEK